MLISIKFYSTLARLPIEENAANVISSLVFEKMVIEKSQNKNFFLFGRHWGDRRKTKYQLEKAFLGEGKLQKSPYFE